MSNSVVRDGNLSFKIFSFIIFFISLLISGCELNVIFLFLIITFIIWRSRIEIFKFLIFFLLLFFVYATFKFFFKINLILGLKMYFIIAYLKYLNFVSNDFEILITLKEIFKDKFVDFVYKVKLFINNCKNYFKISNDLYGKPKYINSIYLSLKKSENDYILIDNLNRDRNYKIIKRNILLYDYLFIVMHVCTLIFCILSEVYL